MKHVKLENDYIMSTTPYIKCDTVVIDNGTYELKGGYVGGMPQIKFKNEFYKDSEGMKFACIKNKNKYTPFTQDLISGFHVLEENIDQVLEYLKVSQCKNLVISDTIHSPTTSELITFLFEVYRFEKIQIGVDAIYSYLHNTQTTTNSIILSFGHTNTMVYLYYNKKIVRVYKLNYGGKDANAYITNLIRYKHKEYQSDCSRLIKMLRCPINYEEEVFDIVSKLRRQEYENNVYINSEDEEAHAITNNITKGHANECKRQMIMNKLRNMNNRVATNSVKKRNKTQGDIDEIDCSTSNNMSVCNITSMSDNESQTRDVSDDSDAVQSLSKLEEAHGNDDQNEEIFSQKSMDQGKPTEQQETEQTGNDMEYAHKGTKNRFNVNAMRKIKLYQLNNKISKIFDKLKTRLFEYEEMYEKMTNLNGYVMKKKEKYEQIVRELELRNKYRRDITNRKTYEFRLLLKTTDLTEEEQKHKAKIQECEDTEVDKQLQQQKDRLLEEISKYDSNYILNASSVLDLLSGKNMNKMLINVDLLRVSEVLFAPSILGNTQMGISEIIENILSEYKDIHDVFITGGFSQIEGLKERIEFECRKYAYVEDIQLRTANDPVYDAFQGACFYDMFPVYTYEEYIANKK